MKSCFSSFKLANEIEKAEIAYSFIEKKNSFLLVFNPLILKLFANFLNGKGK